MGKYVKYNETSSCEDLTALAVHNSSEMAKSTSIEKPGVQQPRATAGTQNSELLAPEPINSPVVAQCRAEVERQDRNKSPLEWAAAKQKLGEALLRLAKYEQFDRYRDAILSEAIDVFNEALKERTRARFPIDWALTKSQLGHALSSRSDLARKQGLADEDLTLLMRAIQQFREAVAERKLLDSSPSIWLETQSSLADTLNKLASIQDDKDAFREAMQAYETLYLEFRINQVKSPKAIIPEDSEKSNALLESAHDAASIRGDIQGVEFMRDKSIITRNGVRYLPLPRVAAMAQASESAVNKWIANRVKFDGRAIETYSSITKDIYVSEQSAKRIAQRFVTWPSNKPAGPVVLGETDDQSGFIGLTDAAKILHVGHHTIWLWVTQEKAPTAKPLDVIKCTVSDYFYIREKDISELKSVIPRSGLRRGRRPREAAQPS